MVWPQQTDPVRQENLVVGQRARVIPGASPMPSDIAAGTQGVGMVWANETDLVRQEGLVVGERLSLDPRMNMPVEAYWILLLRLSSAGQGTSSGLVAGLLG